MELVTASSPHIRADLNTRGIMIDVIIALSPAAIFGMVVFGWRAALIIAVCIATAVLSETVMCGILKKPDSSGDLSAVVTGLLLAMNLPPRIPLYMAVLGSVFAVAAVKMLFGGLGKNIVNPAIAGRVFLLLSFPSAMTSFLEPFSDLTASATPLAGGEYTAKEILFGVCSGCIGETSVVMLLLGGAYLFMRKIITWEIPAGFVGTALLLSLCAGQNPFTAVCSGGLVLGALFMATDYVTSPVTRTGKLVFGAGCGVITMAIRLFAGLPEGVSYSILFMNLLVPLIDRFAAARPLGAARRTGKGGKQK